MREITYYDTYAIANSLLVGLFNDDTSGMSQQDVHDMDTFMEALQHEIEEQFGEDSRISMELPAESEPFFGRCAITRLGASCCDVEIYVSYELFPA